MGFFSKKEKDKKEKISMYFNHISGLDLDKGFAISLNKLEDEILIEYGSGKFQLKIPYSNIVKVYRYTITEEEFKKKSILGRAIVGGVLTGGVGAVIGGMTGIGDKKTTRDVSIVEIDYNISGSAEIILLEDYIVFGTEKFINSIESKVLEYPRKPQIQNNTTNINIPEQIKKLAELKNVGILTEEEFTTKKQELLSKI